MGEDKDQIFELWKKESRRRAEEIVKEVEDMDIQDHDKELQVLQGMLDKGQRHIHWIRDEISQEDFVETEEEAEEKMDDRDSSEMYENTKSGDLDE